MSLKRVMKKLLTDLLLITLLTLNIFLTMFSFAMVSKVNNKMVFDMDKIRYKYMNDVRYYYRSGCLDGTEYPEEYRKNRFGSKNPMNWCGDNVEDMQQNFENDLFKLGK